MTTDREIQRQALERLIEALAKSVLEASDEELRAEAAARGEDLEALGAETRRMVMEAAEKAGDRELLRAMQARRPEGARTSAPASGSNVVAFRLKPSFSIPSPTKMRVAASHRPVTVEKGFSPFMEFTAANRTFRALVDSQGNVAIDGVLDAAWTHIVVGRQRLALERSGESWVKVPGLGQRDVEAFAYEPGEETIRFE